MRKYLAILLCKLLRIVLKIFKRGSSLPGQIALKIDPNILNKVVLPKYVVAVSGSNGKTSTVEMIEKCLTCAGFKVAYNYEGSNQIEGITTLILNDATLSGICKSDVILMEADERYARYSFKHIMPTHFVITNLYRDQLTRNGNPEIIYNLLKESIHDKTHLILNGDDPLVSLLGKDHNLTSYFEIDKFNNLNNIGVYDDGLYCPNCKSKFKYQYRHYGSTGSFNCLKCGFSHPKYNYHINEVNLDIGYLVIDEKYKINLALKSIYNAYNILAAYSLCRELKVNPQIICKNLNDYILKNGRVELFKFNNKEGMFLVSKHENSVSYNQSLTIIKNDNRDVTVLIMVDAISRKYFTSETSWLWDIDFNLLNKRNIKKIILTGLYANDLASRFNFTNIDKSLLYVNSNIDGAFDYLREKNDNFIYAITCFSDMHKILNRVEVL